ncbi:hypothetical protein [Aequorivita marina]|uniref:hypothetical protein n=1 Tax=Aequorivita marina TaxID=3073654 RepID=UPI002876A08E|nr:hypothetical protein [Aequorivita sp. S2608]MDS1297487.1 hypothetical protein [Aequorivita sp. S2608]
MKIEDDKMEAVRWSWELVVSEEAIPTEKQDYEQLKRELAKYLTYLLTNDFNKLISVLYRIDISQEKAMAKLAENAQKESAGDTLARLIIERQLKKVITRR